MSFRLVRPALGVAAALLALAAPPAYAGNFGVSPVNVLLPANARSTSLTITNNEPTPVAVRIRLYAWGKHDGADQLTPSDEFVVTPPIVRIEGRKSQLVRIGRPQKVPPPDVERAYRVVVSEIPLQGQEAAGPRIQTLLEMNVPLFVPPAKPVRDVAWQAQRADGRVVLQVTNTGNAHAKVTQLRVLDDGGARLGEHRGLFYALPGPPSRIEIPLARLPGPGAPLRLEFRLNNTPRTAEIPLP